MGYDELKSEQCSHYKNITFDKCRSCNGLNNICDEYIPRINGRQKDNSIHDKGSISHPSADISYVISRNDNRIRRNHKVLDWIRKMTDGGVWFD